MSAYDIVARYFSKGDQLTATEQLVKGVNGRQRYQTLLGQQHMEDFHHGQRHLPQRPIGAGAGP